MRITCGLCRGDFVLPPERTAPKGTVVGGCPLCGAGFSMIAGEDPENPQVVFASVPAGRRRTCVQCGRDFEGDMSEAIPKCAACLGDPLQQQQASRGWKFIRSGETIELGGDPVVRDWIFQSRILPNDLLIRPDGKKDFAGRFAEFEEAFRVQHRKRSAVKLAESRSIRRRIRSGPILRLLAIAAFAAAVVFMAYRIAVFDPPTAVHGAALEGFVALLESRKPPSNETASAMTARALALLNRDRIADLDPARVLLEQALVKDRNSAITLSLLAEVYARMASLGDDPRNRMTAVALAGLTTRLYPDDPGGYVAQARAEIGAGNLDGASQFVQMALDRDALSPRVLLLRAALGLARAQAVEEFREVAASAAACAKADPDLLEAYDIAGTAYLMTGDPRAALAEFEMRLARSPKDDLAPERIGLLYERAGEYAVARDWYRESLRRSAFRVSARLALAAIERLTNERHRVAADHYNDVLTRYSGVSTPAQVFEASYGLAAIRSGRPSEVASLLAGLPGLLLLSGEVIRMRAEIFILANQPDRARALLAEHLSSQPSDVAASLALARLLARQGEIDEAGRIYRDAMQADPSNRGVLQSFFLDLVRARRPGEALALADDILSRSLDPDEGDLWTPPAYRPDPPPWEELVTAAEAVAASSPRSPSAHALVGFFEIQHGVAAARAERVRRGLAALNKSVQAPNTPDIVWGLIGMGRSALSDWKGSTEAFVEFLKLRPNHPGALYRLGEVAIRRGQLKDARPPLRFISENERWGGRALARLGDIAAEEGDRDGAERFFSAALSREPRLKDPFRALLGR